MADVFICYSRKHPLYGELIEERVKSTGYTCFRDVTGLIPSTDWEAAINSEIEKATVLVAIITEEALKSYQVQREIELALQLHKGCIPLVMERIENMDSSLKQLGLERIHAIYVAEVGLTSGLTQFDQTLRRLTDTWAPIQQNIQRLTHYSPIARLKAVQELAATGDVKVLDAMVEAFEVENNGNVKTEIVRQMVQFDDPRAIDIVLRGHTHLGFDLAISDPYTTFGAMMERFAKNETYFLSSLERMTDEDLKLQAAVQLGRFGHRKCGDVGLETLINLSRFGQTEATRNHARYLITITKHPRAKGVLIEMEQTEPNELIRNHIKQLLSQMGN